MRAELVVQICQYRLLSLLKRAKLANVFLFANIFHGPSYEGKRAASIFHDVHVQQNSKKSGALNENLNQQIREPREGWFS